MLLMCQIITSVVDNHCGIIVSMWCGDSVSECVCVHLFDKHGGSFGEQHAHSFHSSLLSAGSHNS